MSISNRMQLLLACLCLLTVSFAHGDGDERNPLSFLNKKQRRHYEVYAKLNSDMLARKKIDHKQLYVDLYGPVRDWFEDAAPKFKYESMKAGDRAKEVTNKDAKALFIEKSSLYLDMYKNCVSFLQGYKKKERSVLTAQMNAFVANEGKARAKQFLLPRRDWLTGNEADLILWRINAPERAKYKQEQQRLKAKRGESEQPQPQVDQEPETQRQPRQRQRQSNRRGNRNQRNRSYR